MVCFSFLGMRPLFSLQEDELLEWGNDEIKSLATFYTTSQNHGETSAQPYIDTTVQEVMDEWVQCKTTVKLLKYPVHSLQELWGILVQYHKDDFPHLIKLAQLALTHPVHTCDAERTFSVQNLILSPLRNRLSPERSDQLMRVCIEGEKLEEFDFHKALAQWRTQKKRKIFQK